MKWIPAAYLLSSTAFAGGAAAAVRQPDSPFPWVVMASSFIVGTFVQFFRTQTKDEPPKLRVAVFLSLASGSVGMATAFLLNEGADRLGWWEMSDAAVISLAAILGFLGASRVSRFVDARLEGGGSRAD